MKAMPVEGLRVLDLSKVLAGPLCAQYLGDMGADVIKVETPTLGDDTRHWPPFHEGLDESRTGTVFLSANRNKRSLALDLRSAEGRAVVHQLARQADVVIESFGPGAAARLGVDAATLRALHPGLVHCSISGYGSIGPMRDGKGYDLILQAFCGMLSITGERGGPSVRSPFSPVDQATGMHALSGVLAALLERSRTGVGSAVEVSLFDTATGFLGYFLQAYWQRGVEPEKPGSGHESLCPYEAFETQDRPLILGIANDVLWRAFCEVAGLQVFANDARFATNALRVQHRDDTVALVRVAMRGKSRDAWMAELDAAGIPCSPLHSLAELSEHPHTAASGMVYSYGSERLGTLKGVAQPVRFNGERTMLRRPPPAHGEHSRQILRDAGLDEAHINRLFAQGTVQ